MIRWRDPAKGQGRPPCHGGRGSQLSPSGLRPSRRPPGHRRQVAIFSWNFGVASGPDAGILRHAGNERMAIEGTELAMACARAADDIKAEDVRIWDLREVSTLTDYMVICSGESMPHLRAILRDVERTVTDEHGTRPLHIEGRVDSRWVILDYVDVMVHIMDSGLREHYGLERLWGDAKAVEWENGGSATKAVE